MNYLRNCTILIIDGTFKTAPKDSRQVLIVHGWYQCANRLGEAMSDESVAAVHVVMHSKDKQDYQMVFRRLNELLEMDDGSASECYCF